MCGLCGVLGGDTHWSESASAPDVFANRRATVTHRHERLRRAALANVVLDHYGMSLRDWQGASYVLATRTGRTRVIDNLATLWPAANDLAGRVCDPLDANLIAALQGARRR